MVAKAKQRTFLLFRTFLTKNPTLLLLGFKSYILPILDYCSTVWAPCTHAEVKLIESVQRNFTRRIPGRELFSYGQRLSNLGLVSLELRRLRHDLTFCYKILSGMIAGPPSVYGLVLSNRKSRGNGRKLAVQDSRVNVRKNYFSCRVCEPWNSLPDDVVLADTICIFKRLLLDCDLTKFLLFHF